MTARTLLLMVDEAHATGVLGENGMGLCPSKNVDMLIGAVNAAVDLVPTMHRERDALREKASFLRRQINGAGFDTGLSSTQIIPVIVGREAETMALAAYLEENGILASGIRFPTVPASMARIRLALSASHTWEQIRYLASAILSRKDSRLS